MFQIKYLDNVKILIVETHILNTMHKNIFEFLYRRLYKIYNYYLYYDF